MSTQRTGPIIANLSKVSGLSTPAELAERATISRRAAGLILKGKTPALEAWMSLIRALDGQVSLGLMGTLLFITPAPGNPPRPRMIVQSTTFRGVLREVWQRREQPDVADVARRTRAPKLKPAQVRFALKRDDDGNLLPVHRVLTAVNAILRVDLDEWTSVVLAPAALIPRPAKRRSRQGRQGAVQATSKPTRANGTPPAGKSPRSRRRAPAGLDPAEVLKLAQEGFGPSAIARKCRRGRWTPSRQGVSQCLRRLGITSTTAMIRDRAIAQARERLGLGTHHELPRKPRYAH